MWFTPHKMLTYNCLFNFVVGDRGGGKSFGTLKFVIDRFKKTGEQFIYIRRYEQELKDSLPTIFTYLKKEGFFQEDELEVNGGKFYCNKKLMGYAAALSTSMKKKSTALPDVSWIIFEEFMVDGITSRYLGHGEQEVDVFNNFYETIARMRPGVRVLFIANAFSMVNIYFTRNKIRLKPPYKTYNKIGDIMVCIWHDEDYLEAKKKTRFYQLVKDTEYAQHAYENKFYMDSEHFVKKRPPEAEFNFAITYMGKRYGVWADWDNGKYYVTTKVGSVSPRKHVSLSLEDNHPNNVNIRRVKSMPFMLMFRRAVDENNVYYDKLETYAALNEAVFLLRTIS
ncbi:MAG: hypothetical protein EOM07_05125 [Clostridia bacterium]|nr:hypothetical protein [Clostridia bacterium]